MDKKVKSFVEKKYQGILISECIETEVLEKDPMKIENDGYMQGFRFYDRMFISFEGKRYTSEKYNCSNWIYFGKRLSFSEFITQYGNNPHYKDLIINMSNDNCQYVCQIQNGSFLPMNKGDVTFDEFADYRKKEEKKLKEKSTIGKNSVQNEKSKRTKVEADVDKLKETKTNETSMKLVKDESLKTIPLDNGVNKKDENKNSKSTPSSEKNVKSQRQNNDSKESITSENNTQKKYDKESVAKAMFDKLEKHRGEEVTCTWWWHGTKQETIDKLFSITDFLLVKIGLIEIPFVDYGMAISSIIAKNGEVLYLNPYIEDGYNRKTLTEIYESKAKIFGSKIVEDEKAGKLEKWSDYKKKSDKLAREKSGYYIYYGFNMVKPEKSYQWAVFCANNRNEKYSEIVIEATFEMIRRLSVSSIPFEIAEKEVYNEMFHLSDYMIASVANAVVYFSERGEEYGMYWNEQFVIENSGVKRIKKFYNT